jgi:2-polyprenyl-3-methyl-5-hydroxy-6-metoxy-1,4-benzoquinol methylase
MKDYEYYFDTDICEIYESINPLIIDLYSRENKILDIGCSVGALAEKIKSINNEAVIYGIDRSKKAGKIAPERLDKFFCLDLDSQAFPKFDIKFDLIILGDVLEHLKRPDIILTTLSDYLSENGSIIISLPNIAYWRKRLELLSGRFNYTKTGVLDRTHLRFFTYDTATAMINKSGYNILEERCMTPFYQKLALLNRIMKLTHFCKLYKKMGSQFVFKVSPCEIL